MSLPMFVYGSLREGGGLDSLLPGKRRRALLYGWTLYEFGPPYREPWYPVMVRGASSSYPPIVGEVVEVDWNHVDVRHVVEVECGAGYVPAITPVAVSLDGRKRPPTDALAWEWVQQDNDYVGSAIPSGDWMTHRLLRSLR